MALVRLAVKNDAYFISIESRATAIGSMPPTRTLTQISLSSPRAVASLAISAAVHRALWPSHLKARQFNAHVIVNCLAVDHFVEIELGHPT